MNLIMYLIILLASIGGAIIIGLILLYLYDVLPSLYNTFKSKYYGKFKVGDIVYITKKDKNKDECGYGIGKITKIGYSRKDGFYYWLKPIYIPYFDFLIKGCVDAEEDIYEPLHYEDELYLLR